MTELTFITGNQRKADYMARHLGLEIDHQKLDLDEIQSVDLSEIATHKVKQAYELIKKPVIVDDVSLEFSALGGLPGPFIKFFVDHAGLEACSRMLDGFSDRSATAKCVFGYYDGRDLKLFQGGLAGEIAQNPRGENGFGWDKIFIPEGYGGRTRAELTPEEDEATYTTIKPFNELRGFLTQNKVAA
jgi:inosine triphosphate pyrophosphatase